MESLHFHGGKANTEEACERSRPLGDSLTEQGEVTEFPWGPRWF